MINIHYRLNRFVIPFFIISVFPWLAACESLPFADSGPDSCDDLGFLFADDFEGEKTCGWVEYNRSGAVAAIDNGVMSISTSSPGEIWWTNPGRNFDDVLIDVKATQVSGPSDNAYGVICRYQDEENFYIFLISGDGYYAIGKYQSGEDRITYLTEDGQYQSSEFINQDQASNQIEVSCIGNQLSLSVNGMPLMAVTDTEFATGDIGLAASSLQQGTVEIAFDEFKVLGP
ncbi:MAG: hypothetical protein R3293_02385 [Candidatus Promineifilaceae bacterium]|nr:hypothetical protein [Candidatus Promineifilaceae bacterium]